MALFKIEKGLAENLSKNRPNTTEGYCYVTTDDGKFYIDTATSTGTSNRIVLNAGAADIASKTVGTLSINSYEGELLNEFNGQENITITLPKEKKGSLTIQSPDGEVFGTFDGENDTTIEITNGLSEPLILTENISYGDSLPTNAVEGQIFFLEESLDGPILPEGGSAGQVLIKNSNEDGDATWGEIVALPKGGEIGQVLIKKTTVDGDAEWANLTPDSIGAAKSDDLNKYLLLTGGTLTGTLKINDNTASTSTSTGALTVSGGVGVAGNIYGTKVYGAVYNDYAEYRQTIGRIEPGRCVVELGDGSLGVSYKRLEPAPEIVSDTFGFAIGETNVCKTPIAVAGRVLAYPCEAKEEYAVGDPVCSGPMGTISKMTREEVCMYPDRMIGTVSEIPDYETWGQDNIKVNGRIWIRIR